MWEQQIGSSIAAPRRAAWKVAPIPWSRSWAGFDRFGKLGVGRAPRQLVTESSYHILQAANEPAILGVAS